MKKNIIFAFVAVAALVSAFVFMKTTKTDELLRLNVEAIADKEDKHGGSCKDIASLCVGICPICGDVVIIDEKMGPSYDIIEKPVTSNPNL